MTADERARTVDCDRMLDRAEQQLRGDLAPGTLRELARFLGAAHGVWTRARRERLRSLLASCGLAAVEPILTELAACPRAEVFDEAVLALREVLRRAPETGDHLIQAWPARPEAAVRQAILCALAPLEIAGVDRALTRALDDPSPLVREAAASALGDRGQRGGVRALELRLAVERHERVAHVLREAIDELCA